jgi:O-antigen/teichoic acid export membrane protein
MPSLTEDEVRVQRAPGPSGGSVEEEVIPAVQSESRNALRGLFGRDSVYMWLWATQLCIAALSVPVVTRVLGPTRFGLVAAAMAVMQILVALGGFSLQSAVQRVYAGAGGERDARRVVTLAIVVSLGVFVLADSTGPLWSQALGLGGYSLTIQYAVGWAACTAMSNAALGLLRSRNQLLKFGIVTTLQSVVAEMLSLLLVLLVRRTASEFVLGQLIAQGATVATALVMARPMALRRRDLPMLTRALRYSSGLVPAALAAFVLDASDRLIIRHYLGPAAVARYTVAYNIASLTIVLLGVLGAVWMPRMFSLVDERVRASLLTSSRDVLYALLIPAVVGLSAAAPLLLGIWAPPSYRPSGLLLIVAIVAVTAFPYAGMMSAERILMLASSTLTVGIATVIASLTNIGLNVLLVPRVGIIGASLSTFAAYGLLFALLSARARGITRLPPPPMALVGKIVAAVAVSVLTTQLPAGPVTTVVRAALTTACLIAFVAILSSILAPSRYSLARRIAAAIHPTDVWVAI